MVPLDPTKDTQFCVFTEHRICITFHTENQAFFKACSPEREKFKSRTMCVGAAVRIFSSCVSNFKLRVAVTCKRRNQNEDHKEICLCNLDSGVGHVLGFSAKEFLQFAGDLAGQLFRKVMAARKRAAAHIIGHAAPFVERTETFLDDAVRAP